ncbi:BAH_G0004980.mRNA.1.CDS.1 [Saccharomyces cerevisiae]|nr:BAH_G0004980.mRNA.1.CDS.1 [Saccharomyces cerevisiae]CAI7053175.1 BAH_G0004980.mRNA.1.CDS.1 [Saccharomyces cerevisiae]
MSIPADIASLISDKYKSAFDNGNLKFIQTETTKTKDPKTSMPYLISHMPSLIEKPERGQTPEGEDPLGKPEEELTVIPEFGGADNKAYKLLLNKFPVIPEHTLLVTNEYQHQTDALTPTDLLTAYKLLCALDNEESDKRHMVFYNSGPASGSSLDHKHLQILQMPEKFVTFQDRLCNGKEHFLPTFNTEPLQDAKVSFAHFVLPMPESEETVDEDLLAMCYISILQRALTFFQDWLNENPELKKSYNLMLTKEWICVIPRSKAFSDEMKIGFNSTGYCGMILTKNDEVFSKITEKPELINDILLECGFPNTSGQKPNEYNY